MRIYTYVSQINGCMHNYLYVYMCVDTCFVRIVVLRNVICVYQFCWRSNPHARNCEVWADVFKRIGLMSLKKPIFQS